MPRNRKKKPSERSAADNVASRQTVASEEVESVPPGGTTQASFRAGLFVTAQRRDALALGALAVAVFVSYYPALGAGFVWDDEIVLESRLIQEASGLWRLWLAPTQLEGEVHYWPVVYSSFWLEHKLWGFDPLGYHLVNLVLHFANVVLLWGLLRRLTLPGAWAVAAVFAVHPLHVESVAWVIERKDLLSGLFYLSAAWLWLGFEKQPTAIRYLGALFLFALALLSKSIAVTLPVALMIVAWWKRGRVTGVEVRRLLPFFAVALLITAADLSYYDQRREWLDFEYSLVERALIASRSLWFYLGKLAWPTELMVIYPRWDVGAGDPWAWAYLAACAGLAAVLWLGRHRLGRAPLASALFFAVTLSPALGFVDFSYMYYSFVADRFQYLAGIGAMALVVGGAFRAASRLERVPKAVAAGLLAVVLVLLGTLTWRQSGVYRDEVSLFGHIVSLNPQALSAHMNLGSGLIDEGRFEEGLAASLEAVERRPNYAAAHANAGLALSNLNRLEEAEKHLRRALELVPGLKEALQSLGETLRLRGRYEESLEWFRASARADPDQMQPHAGLGDSLYHLGRYDEAVEALERAVSLDPPERMAGSVHRLLGLSLEALERPEEAEPHFERAIAIDPNDEVSVDRLGTMHFARKRYAQMLELYQSRVDAGKTDARVYTNLGTALYFLQRYEEALQSFESALALDPDQEMALHGLERSRQRLESERTGKPVELIPQGR